MKEVNQENVAHLMGATFDHSNTLMLIWLHMGRRSLESVLFDEAMQLNAMFKASITRDLVKVTDCNV